MVSTYLNSLNWFRGVAIIFVVLTHVDSSVIGGGVGDYFIRIFSNGSFLFVFVSGYLFWHLIHKYQYKKFIVGKFKNVLVPYLFVMSVAVAVFSWMGYMELGLVNVAREFFVGGGLVGPLWFVPMIFLVFLLSPVLVCVANSKYFSVVLIVLMLFSVTSFRPERHVYPLYMVMHFLGVFLFGVFLKKNEAMVFSNALKISLFSVPFFLGFLYLDVVQSKTGLPYFWPLLDGFFVFNYSQLQKVFLVVFLIGLLFWVEGRFSEFKIPFLDFFAKYSFGIFFYHGFFVLVKDFMVRKGVLDRDYAGVLSYFFDFFVFLMLSIAICMVMQRAIGSRSRYFSGVAC